MSCPDDHQEVVAVPPTVEETHRLTAEEIRLLRIVAGFRITLERLIRAVEENTDAVNRLGDRQ